MEERETLPAEVNVTPRAPLEEIGGRVLGGFIHLIATMAYTGYIPWAPGTAGTMIGIGVYGIFLHHPPLLYGISLLALMALAVWASGVTEFQLGRRDHPAIVIDEVVGFLVTMAWIPPGLAATILGFFIFRLMDIIKPPPIRWMEKHLQGGLGVVMDDVLAGLYANILLRAVLAFMQ